MLRIVHQIFTEHEFNEMLMVEKMSICNKSTCTKIYHNPFQNDIITLIFVNYDVFWLMCESVNNKSEQMLTGL